MDKPDTGHYIENEQETFCWFCKRVTKAFVVQHDDNYVVICKHCKSRGPKAVSEKEAWKLWEGYAS